MAKQYDHDYEIELHLAEISGQARLTAEDEHRLGAIIRSQIPAGDDHPGSVRWQAARHKLIVANLPLVVWKAKQIAGLTLADRIQAGYLGLIRAAEKYDPAKGAKGCRFSTYATHWIFRFIIAAVDGQGFLIHLPPVPVQLLGRLRHARAAAMHASGTEPTLAELARTLGERVETVVAATMAARPIFDLDGLGRSAVIDPRLSDGVDPQEYDPLCGRNANRPELGRQRHGLDWPAFDRELKRAVASLPQRWRKIIELRFGLRGDRPHQLHEIGHRMHISKERVRQLQNQALAAMRQKWGDELEEFLEDAA